MLPILLSIFAITPQAWLEDFHQLQYEMSTHYANLDSAIDDRRMDLSDLRCRTEEAVRKAKSDEEARQALDAFMRAFGDGHVSIDWSPQAPTPPTDKPKTLCERLRFRAREDTSGVDFSRLTEFTPITDRDTKTLPGGILSLSRDRRVGILRILLFTTDIHPHLCQQALKNLGLADDASCSDDCELRVRREVSNLLTAALERRIESLRAAGATSLLVDVTGNGGGTDWVEAAARVLTPVPLKSPRIGFIKHPHWVRRFTEELIDIDRDLAAGVEPRQTLLEAHETLRRAMDLANETCDRSGVWLDQPKRPECSLVVSDLLFASGVMPYAKPGSIPKGSAELIFFRPSEFTYREGLNRLPLFVLIDGRTASASELFAAMLKDNRAATLIGTHTLGSGCGHTNGGIFATLKHSGARVELPDCVRLRADGTNEVVGIAADVYVPWRGFDSRYQRAAKTMKALERVAK